MTTVVFESAALADCFKRANRVAPRSGSRAAEMTGFVLSLAGDEVAVRTTNGDVFYRQVLRALSSDAPASGEEWRIPSQVATKVVSSLPRGKGQTVTLTEVGGVVRVTSGKMNATLALVDSFHYPRWGFHDLSEAPLVEGFGTHLDRIAWATEKGHTTATSCVMVTGESLLAATSSAMAVTPCRVPLEGRPHALLPLSVLAPILSQMVDVRVKYVENFLVLEPTPDTQIKTVTMDLSFPNVSAPMSEEFTGAAAIDREQATEILARVRAIVGNDDGGHVWLTIGNGAMSFFTMEASGGNSVSDVVDVEGAEHSPVTLRMSADTLTAALGKSPGASLTVHYDTLGKSRRVRVDGDDSYSCWIPLIRQG